MQLTVIMIESQPLMWYKADFGNKYTVTNGKSYYQYKGNEIILKQIVEFYKNQHYENHQTPGSYCF